MKKKRIHPLFILHLLIALYSLSSVFSKIASECKFTSITFCLSYAAVLFILAIYAVGWQQVIKKIPLSTAFANKSFTVVWGLIYGVLIFDEKVTLGKLIGLILIVLGVIIFVRSDMEVADVE